MGDRIQIGDQLLRTDSGPIEGGLVEIDGQSFYRISNYDGMAPFFMSLTSSSNHWMFVSSNGGLTAGRKNAENALFPYYTDDKIHDGHHTTGSKTVLLVARGSGFQLWEPFADAYAGLYRVERNLFKCTLGNRLIFQEVNHDLGLVFEYEWTNSNLFGFVKRSRLINLGKASASVRIADGLQNILPYGVNRDMQTSLSTLVDAYKKNELLPESGLGLFLLSSIPVDRAEPSEALKATTVWSAGIEPSARLVSSRQIDRFKTGVRVVDETDIRAERGAYFTCADLALEPGDDRVWHTVAEVNQGPSDVAALSVELGRPGVLIERLEADMQDGRRLLNDIIAGADGLQLTRDRLSCARHVSNVLFNVMRGGTTEQGYHLDKGDFAAFVKEWNSGVASRNREFLDRLPEAITLDDLLGRVGEQGDPQLVRLSREYLPLSFSRRHGDPSRPWNQFSIEVESRKGTRNLHYEGNWRDIFQNWEALALSYPGYVQSMISKFVSASTPDGYNPYRISRRGIDWEVIDPDDPWSYIGYWGDHQLIYLLKLLEISQHHRPGTLRRFLRQPTFAYAAVPYRIKSFDELVADPHDTIVFDAESDELTRSRAGATGSDGKLVWDDSGEVYLVNLTEKLLVSVLSKLANFVLGAGIWMNTQRPEWNDANNALVGRGVSVVTLCHLRRYLAFFAGLVQGDDGEVELSEEVADWFEGMAAVLADHRSVLSTNPTDTDRWTMLEGAGRVSHDYRSRIYETGFSGRRRAIPSYSVAQFLEMALEFVDQSVKANRRADGLFHSYNIMSTDAAGSVTIESMYLMLEGQVAALTSGLLSTGESLELLDSLRSSELFREDQHSYMLYPDRTLPRFTEKNIVPDELVAESTLLQQMLASDDKRLVERDVVGLVHFNGTFRNRRDVEAALEQVSDRAYRDVIEREGERIASTFEAVFDHQKYTGRSGTFFGYEGLGSIYWHMVSKLLLAVAEVYQNASKENAGEDVLERLFDHYYDIRYGIGISKNPSVYGAFPTDPYSHTPGTAGAQQPGMTGQVKEDIIARWAELGIVVADSILRFEPGLLRDTEFTTSAEQFEYVDADGARREVTVPAQALAFTYCQVPIIYRRADRRGVEVAYRDGRVESRPDHALSFEESSHVFDRTGEIRMVEVSLSE